MHPDEAIARLAETQHGFFTRRQARSTGFTTEQIRHRLVSGRWVAEYRSVYRIAGWTAAFPDRAFAAHLAAGARTFVGDVTAGRLWTFPGLESVEDLHLLVLDRRRIRIPGLEVHRPRQVTRSDVTRLGLIPITSPGRTLIDLAGSLTQDQLEECVDSALRRGLVTPQGLLRRVRSAGTSKRLEALITDRSQNGAVESVLESRFVHLIRDHHLPEPVRQFVIEGVGRVDFAYPALKIAIEVDGYAYHSSRQRFDADRERDHRLRERGWVVLRFTSTQLRERPVEVASRISTALADRVRGLELGLNNIG